MFINEGISARIIIKKHESRLILHTTRLKQHKNRGRHMLLTPSIAKGWKKFGNLSDWFTLTTPPPPHTHTHTHTHTDLKHV
jgi:hypothetical protein